MSTFAAVCIFCEDLRELGSGQDIIIGTLPDNVVIEGPPPPTPASIAHIPKLGVYLRAQFRTDDSPPKEVFARIENDLGVVIIRNGWSREMVAKAFADAQSNKMPYAGLILKLVIGPVQVPAPGGKLLAILEVDGEDYVAGALNLILPTASVPPALQSPPASLPTGS